MDEIIKTAIPALIAFLGTLLTILIGYRQWKSQRDLARSQKFQGDRELAYKQLWEKLEDVHLKIRTDSTSKSEFDELLKDVNTYLLRNSLYIEKTDQKITAEYLDSVWKVNQLIAKSKDKRIKEEWTKTGPLPAEALDEHKELQAAWKVVDEARDRVVSRFQNILAGREKPVRR